MIVQSDVNIEIDKDDFKRIKRLILWTGVVVAGVAVVKIGATSSANITMEKAYSALRITHEQKLQEMYAAMRDAKAA